MTSHIVTLFATVAATASLVACGGGSGYSNTAPGSPPPPPPGAARGTLLGTENLSSKSQGEIDAFGSDGSKGPIAPGETATCAVTMRQINYVTVDPQGYRRGSLNEGIALRTV